MRSENPCLIAVALLFTCSLAFAAEVPSPALLVLNKEGSLVIVNPNTRQVLGTVRTGDGPHETVASSDGKLAFVSNYSGPTGPGKSISVIDLAERKEIHRVDLTPLSMPHGLAFAGGKLYFTAEQNKIIGAYDLGSNKVDWLLGTGQDTTHMIEVSPDLNRIFTTNITSNSVSILQRTGTQNWEQTVIPVGKGPEGFDITPDGKELWTANSQDGSVSVIDIAAKRVVNSFNVQTKRSNRLKFSPDGRLVLITDLSAGELLVMERATKKELKRINVGRQCAGIVVQPDSSRAYIAVTGDNNVAVIDLKTLELQARIQTGNGPDGMAWIGQ